MKNNIKKFVRFFLYLLVTVLFLFRPILQLISILYRMFYSEWKRRDLKQCSKDVVLFPPIILIGGKNITIGSNVVISVNSTISAWSEYGEVDKFNPEITIGDGCAIGSNSHITSINSIKLGNGVLLGKNVTITDNSHGTSIIEHINLPPRARPMYSKGPVIIEENVWIGDKATILPDVTIGKNSIIGANTVITKSIPSNCIAIGNPAKIIKYLN